MRKLPCATATPNPHGASNPSEPCWPTSPESLACPNDLAWVPTAHSHADINNQARTSQRASCPQSRFFKSWVPGALSGNSATRRRQYCAGALECGLGLAGWRALARLCCLLWAPLGAPARRARGACAPLGIVWAAPGVAARLRAGPSPGGLAPPVLARPSAALGL